MMLGILTIAPLTVSAATYGDFEYTIENNSTCTITKYNGSAANVIIPSTIYGYKVCKIGERAFSKNLNLKNITLPNSITCIDWAAFHDCTKLEHINIPNSITYIGGGAFDDCAKLEHITIPNSVTYIGDAAFMVVLVLIILSYLEVLNLVHRLQVALLQNVQILKVL